MLKIKTGYKVFRGVHTLKPATTSALQKIRYRVNAWTEQNIQEHGAFAVFQELEQAKAFKSMGYGTQIRKVDFIESEEKSLWKKKPPEFSRNRYGKGYHAVSAGIDEMCISSCPDGTILAKEVYVYPEIVG